MILTHKLTAVAQGLVARLAALYFFIYQLSLLKGIIPLARHLQEYEVVEATVFDAFQWIVAGAFLYWITAVISNWISGWCHYQINLIYQEALQRAIESGILDEYETKE